jgi:glutathione S-transferase
MLTLYGHNLWISPYVLSVFVTLREKDLPFDVKEVALDTGDHFAPDFAKLSLTSRVPALVDGAFALSESSAIVEYLEDRYVTPQHKPVLPVDVKDRARARQVMAWIRSDLMPIREERSAENVFYPKNELPPLAPLSQEARFAEDKLFRVAEQLVPKAGGPLFGAWCVADTDLAMMLQRLIKTGADVPSRLKAYADAEWERPFVREFRHHARPPFRPARMGHP